MSGLAIRAALQCLRDAEIEAFRFLTSLQSSNSAWLRWFPPSPLSLPTKSVLRRSLSPVSPSFTAPTSCATLDTQVCPAARRSRSKVRASVLLFVGSCQLPMDRSTSLQRPCVGRLPRPTGLPARSPGDCEDCRSASTSQTPSEPSLRGSEGRFRVGAERTVVPRPEDVNEGIYI